MKLTKLFLLIPAFMMIGCKGNTPTPSEEDKSIITEAEFTAIFQDLRLFREENVVMRSEIEFDGETFALTAEAENGVTKYYDEPYEENRERYIEFDDDVFTVIRYEDGNWYAKDNPMEEVNDYFFDKLAFIPFEFKDFTRDEDAKAYVAEEVIIDFDGDTNHFQDVKITFNEAKPVLVSMTFWYDDDPNQVANFTQTFTYGNAHVVNPK